MSCSRVAVADQHRDVSAMVGPQKVATARWSRMGRQRGTVCVSATQREVAVRGERPHVLYMPRAYRDSGRLVDDFPSH
jgi:hypothetical protein